MTGVRGRRLLAVAVVLVVAAPGLASVVGIEHDDHPLSTYPMFARARPQQTVLTGAVLVDAAGSEHRLSPTEISGSPEPLQAAALVSRALATDPGRLCARILERTDPLEEGERVLLVRERVDAVAHYTHPDTHRGDGDRRRAREVDCTGVAG